MHANNTISFPVYTNLFVIAICYAAIAPLVLGFAAIGLYFFYFAFRYNFMFVSNATIDVRPHAHQNFTLRTDISITD